MAAAEIPDPYLCYAWTSPPGVQYVGSVTKPWQYARGRTPLQCRLARYLHRAGTTNLRIMDAVADLVLQEAVTLCVLRFDAVYFGVDRVDRERFAHSPALVLAVETLLIASYKQADQCQWNRTGVDRAPEPPL